MQDQSGQWTDESEGNESAVLPTNRVVVSPNTARVSRRVLECMDVEQSVNGDQRAQTTPSRTQIGPELIPQCQTCFELSVPDNCVLRLDSQLTEKWRSIGIQERNGSLVYSVQDAVTGRSESRSVDTKTVLICQVCREQFGSIYGFTEQSTRSGNLSFLSSTNEEVKELKAAILSRRSKNMRTELEDVRALSKQCFLSDKCNTRCSDSPTGLYHPRRLSLRNEEVLKCWVKLFSKTVGTDKSLVQSLLARNDEEYLCAKHTTTLKNTLKEAESSVNGCCICTLKGNKSQKRKITVFDWESLSKTPTTVCVVEDAVAVYTGNKLRPADIRRLCCGCRRVVTRNVQMKGKVPKDEVEAKRNDAFFEHGPTPKAVRILIVEIRHELWDRSNNKHVVFLKDIRKRYDELVFTTGEHRKRLAHNESLKKYLLPSLAKTDIHLQCGSKKIGAYFCTRESFDVLAAEAKEPRDDDVEMTRKEEKALLDQLKRTLIEKREEIDSFRWKLRDFILLIPKKLWFRDFDCSVGPVLESRARALAKLNKRSYDKEWPFNPTECPEDLHGITNHEFTTVASVFHLVESRVFVRSARRVRGPVITALTVTANEYGTTYFVSILNRLAVIASYQHLDRLRKKTIAAGKSYSPFEDLVRTAFVSVQIDNINLRAEHALAVHGSTYYGFDGLAMQALNSNVSYNFMLDYRKRSPSDNLPKFDKIKQITRDSFMEKEMPSFYNPDVEAYTKLLIGLAVTNKRFIASKDRSKQKSFRKVVLDGLAGFSGGKAQVVYVSVKRCNPNQAYEIIEMLKKVEAHYNPPGCKQRVFIAVVGDQPIFKVLFELWLHSLINNTWLCQWMVPIPGGFHIDKQGLIYMVKKYLAGSGVEQLLPFSGLSDRHQETFHDLKHYRKNRRVIMQAIAAQLLRLEAILRSIYPDLADSVRKWLMEIEAEAKWLEELDEKDRISFLCSEERSKSISDSLPNGSSLVICPSVSPNVLKIGELIYDKVQDISKHSVNMNFFAKTMLLDVMVPWSGYNILTRKGQTEIVETFYLRFVGVLHGTTKINYQELSLYYAVARAFMPQTVHDVLYKHRHLVASASASSTEANCALDDCIESGIILDSKSSNPNNPKVMQDWPYWATTRASAKNVLRSELAPSRSNSAIHADAGEGPGLQRKGRDREKATATNVGHMLEFLTAKQWLGEQHIAMEFICNVLTDPHEEIRDRDFANQILSADRKGRLAASMHLSCKMPDIFGDLADEERKVHFDDKPMDSLRGHWTKKRFNFRSMADMLQSSLNSAQVGFKKKEKPKKIIENMHKRYRQVVCHRNALDKVVYDPTENDARKQEATRMRHEFDKNSHIHCSRAYAFRKSLDQDIPYRETRSDYATFYETLQSNFEKIAVFGRNEPFIEREPESINYDISSLHIDITDDVKTFRPTVAMNMETRDIGGAVFSKMYRKMKPLVTSARYKDLVDLQVHVDVQSFKPPQVNCEKRLQDDSTDVCADETPKSEKSLSGEEPQAEAACADVQPQTLAVKKESFMDTDHGSDYKKARKERLESCATDTELTETWNAIMSVPANYEFLTSLHAVFAAKAAVHHFEELSGISRKVEHESSTCMW